MRHLLRSFVFCLPVFCLISCADTKINITSYDGTGNPIGTYETRTVVYGKHNAVNVLFGQTDTTNLDAGFKILAKLFSDLVAAYVAGSVFQAQEATKQAASAGASKAQIAKIDAAAQTQALKINADTTKTGIGAGLFAPEAATFIQK